MAIDQTSTGDPVEPNPRWRAWKSPIALRVPIWAWPVLVVVVTAALGESSDQPWLVVTWLGAVAGIAVAQLALIALEPAPYASKAAGVFGSIAGTSAFFLLAWQADGMTILPM